MTNILFSSIDKKIGFNDMQAECLKKEIKNGLNIVFIATIFDDCTRSDEQLNRYIKYFNDININFNSSYVIDNRLNKNDASKIVNDADIVFLMGGSPDLQMKSIVEYGLNKSFNANKIYIGVSAGSMNQSKRVIYKDEYMNNTLLDYKGLGLVDINIFPHFDLNDKDLLSEAYEVSNYVPLILLPNESFVMVKDDVIRYYGKYYLLNNEKMKNGIFKR